MTPSEPDFWPHQGLVAERGGPHFAELIDEVRRLQDQLVTAALPDDVAVRVRRRLSDVANTLAAHRVPPRTRRPAPGSICPVAGIRSCRRS